MEYHVDHQSIPATGSGSTAGTDPDGPTDTIPTSVLELWTIILQVFRWENEGIRGPALIERITPEVAETTKDMMSQWNGEGVDLEEVLSANWFDSVIKLESNNTSRRWCDDEIARLMTISEAQSFNAIGVAPVILTLSQATLAVLVIPKVAQLDAFQYVVLDNSDSSRLIVSSFATSLDASNYILTLGPGVAANVPPLTFSWVLLSSKLLHQDRTALPFLHVEPQEWYAEPVDTAPSIGTNATSSSSNSPALPPFNCAICYETHEGPMRVNFRDCSHDFCRSCLRQHTQITLKAGRFPVYCPCCMVGSSALDKIPMVNIQMMRQMGLQREDQKLWYKLSEAKTHFRMDCPRCSKSILVPKSQRSRSTPLGTFSCPTSGCHQRFCKNCLGSVSTMRTTGHVCPGVEELERTMKQNGWRKCPGCGIPTEKIAGCDYITCDVFGCHTYWLYSTGRQVQTRSTLRRFLRWLRNRL